MEMMGRTHMAFGTLFTATGLPVANQALGLNLSTSQLLVGCAIGTVAGILPDIDHPDSLITHGIIPGSGVFGVIGKMLGWFLSIPPRVVGMFARQVMVHRGGTHSFAFAVGWALLAAPIYGLFFTVVAFGLGAILAPAAVILGLSSGSVGSSLAATSSFAIHGVLGNIPLIAISVFLGYLAHLFSDSLTSAPVPWPWPMHWGPNRGRWFFLPKGLRVRTNSKFETEVIKPVVMLLSLAALVVFVALPAGSSLWKSNNQKIQQIKGQPSQNVKPKPGKAKIHSYNTGSSHSH
jgi:membrane-bound metal-dependent hydrolase YbcI (DUF457 family)